MRSFKIDYSGTTTGYSLFIYENMRRRRQVMNKKDRRKKKKRKGRREGK